MSGAKKILNKSREARAKKSSKSKQDVTNNPKLTKKRRFISKFHYRERNNRHLRRNSVVNENFGEAHD